MAKIRILPFILLVIPLTLAQNITTVVESTTILTNITTEPTPVTYEYIVKLVFSMKNEKIPDYMIDEIFNYSNNIIIEDVISLYTIETLDLNSTIDVLRKLQYDPYKVFSIDGLERFLEDFNVAFKDFYNNVFYKNLNITGLDLRNFLKALNLNTGEFSDELAFGEAFDIFKKGNFSEFNFENALEILGKSKDELFIACRDEVLRNSKLKTKEEFFNILKKHNFDKVEAMNLWKILDLEIENIESVSVFSNLLNQAILKLGNASYLGVLTSDKVAINNKTYEEIKEQMQISKIYVQSFYDNTTIEIKEEKPHYKNIVILQLETNNFTTFVEVATTNENLEHCQFITVENETLISQNIEKITNDKSTLKISTRDFNTTNLIQGSPLICNNKVYGLAKEIDNDNIIFDTFLVHSGVIKTICNPFLIVTSTFIYLKMY